MYPARLIAEEALVRGVFGLDPSKVLMEEPPGLGNLVMLPPTLVVYSVMVLAASIGNVKGSQPIWQFLSLCVSVYAVLVHPTWFRTPNANYTGST